MVSSPSRHGKRKKIRTLPSEVEGWGSFDLADLTSPAASKILLSFLLSRVGGVALSAQLGIPRSSIYAYLRKDSDGPRREARKKILDFALSQFPLETKTIIRDSVTRLNYYLSSSGRRMRARTRC